MLIGVIGTNAVAGLVCGVCQCVQHTAECDRERVCRRCGSGRHAGRQCEETDGGYYAIPDTSGRVIAAVGVVCRAEFTVSATGSDPLLKMPPRIPRP